MKTLLITLTFVFTASGCGVKDNLPSNEELKARQAKREQIFMNCLKIAPTGPLKTHYNDWAEVVEECGRQAYMISERY